MKKMIFIITALIFAATVNAQINILVPADNSIDDLFGVSVSVKGNYALIGATGNNDTGGAYIYRTTDSGITWEEKQLLTSPDISSADHFGVAVSLDENYAIVGADWDDDNGAASGSAYVFKLNASGWTIHDKLLPDDGTEYDFFGASVALQGNVAVVASWEDSYAKSNANPNEEFSPNSPNVTEGSVYFFKRNGNAWQQKVKFQSPAGSSTKSYGCSISLDNNIAVVGSYFENNARGRAYVYKTTDGGDSWNPAQILSAPDAVIGDNFGTSVSVSGNYIIVGAPKKDTQFDDKVGAAYVYVTTDGGNTWSFQTKLTASDQYDNDLFGIVSISGNYALIGAYENDDNGTDSGSAYLFERSGEDWNQITKILPPDGAAYDYFGFTNAISADYVLIGAPFNEDNGYQSGKAYISNLADVVPVELISFSANVEENNVALNWRTATETNNYGFEIERASSRQVGTTPSRVWEKIGFVAGNGIALFENSYSFVDENISAGNYKYRLKQIDTDGSYEYSETVEAEIAVPSKFELNQNYPNPFGKSSAAGNSFTTIKYSIPNVGNENSASSTNVKLKIYDALGREVATLVNERQEPGNYSVRFSSDGLPSGVYFYRLQSGDYAQTKKMILRR